MMSETVSDSLGDILELYWPVYNTFTRTKSLIITILAPIYATVMMVERKLTFSLRHGSFGTQ